MMASLRLLEDGIKATVKQMEDKAERKLAEARELGAINTRIEERITNFDEEFETKRVLLDSFIHNGKLVAEFD